MKMKEKKDGWRVVKTIITITKWSTHTLPSRLSFLFWLLMESHMTVPDSGKGKDLLLQILREEGKLVEYLRCLKRGDDAKVMKITADIIARHRPRFNEAMGITGGA